MNITQLLQRCNDGNPAAVEELFQSYHRQVFRLALSILDDGRTPDCVEEADEVSQEVFLTVLRALADFRGDSAFSTWLFTITVNACRSRLRKRSTIARLRRTLRGLLQTTGREGPSTPEECSVLKEQKTLVWEAVRTLNTKHRLVVVLHYYQNVPVAEIAKILGVQTGTVLSRLHTARWRLRYVLSEKVNGEQME
jgi:RNA polymerase sigma-70 factor, ECF subfamily